MDKGKLCILLLSGLCGFSLALPRRHFYFINTPKTWLEAARYCQANHTDMATVNDEQDLGELISLVPPGKQFAHLGLMIRWSWSLSENDDHKEGEQSFWAFSKDDQLVGRCASMGPSGEWNTTWCLQHLTFFCYEGYVTDLSKRFMMGNGSLTWPEAQSYCRTHHTDLARIRNHKENSRLRVMAHDRQVWIGMAVWRWLWSDGTDSSYIPWLPNLPPNYATGDCGRFWINNNNPGVISGSCTEKLPFYCYNAPRKKYFMKLKLSADSSVNLRDPAVTASIHLWVKRKLEEKGARKDVKLKWKAPQVTRKSGPSIKEENCVL